MKPHFKSIVSRIVWLQIIAVGLTSAAVIIVIHALLNSTAANFQNQVLRNHADTISHYLGAGAAGRVELNLPEDLRAVYAHGYGGFAYAVVDRAGNVLFSSRPSREPVLAGDPRRDVPYYFQNLERRPLYYGASFPVPVGDRMVWVQVAQDLEHPDVIVDDIIAGVGGKLAWLTIPIMILLAAIDIFVVRRALLPVVHASEMARAINPARMDVRLPTEDQPGEIMPLVRAINLALDRLEAGFKAQREFTADAAHELRTPLSVLRMRIDTLSDRTAAAALAADADAMSRVIEQLLAIAELEHFSVDMSTRLDLRDVCAEVVAFLAPIALAQDKDIALVGTPDSVFVTGDRHTLFQALRNLAENAIRHTPPGTTVEIELQPQGAVRVLDGGAGVPEAERHLVFSRFWRKDRQRSGHAGLGLSIVARVVELHGGTITVENRLTGGAAFTMTLRPDRG